jgi:hypothetical protein
MQDGGSGSALRLAHALNPGPYNDLSEWTDCGAKGTVFEVLFSVDLAQMEVRHPSHPH